MELSRRELGAAALGIAAAPLSCRRGARAQVPGALVDHAVQAGHLLRGPALERAQELLPVEVLVVGGGVAGLSAAWRLRAAGVEKLRVLDVEDALGGTSRSGRTEATAFPWGAHYLPAPLWAEGPAYRLLEELGAVRGLGEHGAPEYAEELLVREPEERLFYRGRWHEGLYLRPGASPGDLAQFERFEAVVRRLSAARDGKGRKAFAVPVEKGSDDAEWTGLDRVSMADWLTAERFDSPRLRWLVDYACRDDFGAKASGVSAYAGLWYFCARRDGERESPGHLAWPEGNGRLVAQLASALTEGQRQAGLLVHAVEPDEGEVRVFGVEASTRRPVGFRARQVVLAVPQFVAARVLEPFRRARPWWVDRFVYGPWVVANLFVSRLPSSRGFPLCWDNVLYDSPSLGYVVATHQREVADESGPSVLTWYQPLGGSDPRREREALLSTDYAHWEAAVMADLSVPHPELAATATRLEVMRWGHAMVRPVPGFLFSGVRAAAQASLGGKVHFAHSDLGGLAVFEEANWHGVRAAEAVLAELGKSFSSWL